VPRLPVPAVVAAIVVTTMVLVASGCSGDDASGDEPDRAPIDAGLASIYAGDHAGEEDAAAGECFADELSDVSADRLREAGVLDDDFAVVSELPPLDPDLAEAWVDAQLACGDFVEASTRAQQRVTKGKIDAEAYAGCLREELSEAQVRAALVATMQSEFEDPAVATLAQAQDTCAAEAKPPDS
jgi:hypothetical protein